MLSAFATALLAAGCGDDDAVHPDAPAPSIDAAAPGPPDAAPEPADAAPPDSPPPVEGDRCATATILTPGADPIQASTGAMRDDTYGTCSLGTTTGPDAVYHISLGDTPIDFIAVAAVDETVEQPYDAVLYARAVCGKLDSQLGCIDAGWGDTLELLGVTGQVFLFVDGTEQYGGAPSGDYTLTTAVRAIAGDGEECDPGVAVSRCAEDLRCVDAHCVADSAELECTEAIDITADLADGSATVTGATYRFYDNLYDGSCRGGSGGASSEQIIRSALPAAGDLVASTDDPGTAFDTYLYLRSDTCYGDEVACNDDIDLEAHELRSRLVADDLPAGTYYLFIDGSSTPGAGKFHLELTFTPG
jgi:hypothetical protein